MSSQGAPGARAQPEVSAHSIQTQTLGPGEGCKGRDRGIRVVLPRGSAEQLFQEPLSLRAGRCSGAVPSPRHGYCHSTEHLQAKPVLIKARTTTQPSQRPKPPLGLLPSPASQPCRGSLGFQAPTKAAPVLSLHSTSTPQISFGWVRHNTAALTFSPVVKLQFLALSPDI